MKQLSEENQEWLDDNTDHMKQLDESNVCIGDVHKVVLLADVEEKLLADQKRIDELEKIRDEQSRQLSDRESRMSEYLSTIDALRKENAEIKELQQKYVWIAREEMKEYSDIHQALLGQSLAQHDKETIKRFVYDYLVPCAFLSSDLDLIKAKALDFGLEQLQEQE